MGRSLPSVPGAHSQKGHIGGESHLAGLRSVYDHRLAPPRSSEGISEGGVRRFQLDIVFEIVHEILRSNGPFPHVAVDVRQLY